MNTQERLERALRVASLVLGASREEADENCRYLEADDVYYFWRPVRGGGAAIVAPDDGFLFANSSVSFDVLLDAFRAGRRTDPSLLEEREPNEH